MVLNWKHFVFFSLLAIVNAQLRASHNETCGEGIRCDSRKSLSCINGTCECVKPDEMRYEAVQQKCAVLPGERCSYTAVEMLSDTTQEKRWTEKLNCVTNATCNSDGFCDCETYHFENAENFCTPKLRHGQNCTRNEQCRADLNFMCEMGFCSCNKTEAIFDKQREACVGLVGARCGKYGNTCVQNAQCYYRNGYYYDDCRCSSGYERSTDGLCKGGYDSSCSINSPCSEDWTCFEGKCRCHYPDHQSYEQGKCISYIRGPCHERRGDEIKSYDCVKNANCANSTGIFKCTCNKGMIESIGRKCKVAYGETCESPNICDSAAGLVCKNGKCLCGKDFEAYDFEVNKCRGLVGAMCLNNSYCIDRAICEKYRDPSMRGGTCNCSSNFEPSWERSCLEIAKQISQAPTQTNGAVLGLNEDLDDVTTSVAETLPEPMS